MKRRRWRKKQTGFGAAVGFLREYEQKKTGTASGSVTVNHDAVGSSPTGGAIQALLRQCFFVAQAHRIDRYRCRKVNSVIKNAINSNSD